jgi:hypothetical protein
MPARIHDVQRNTQYWHDGPPGARRVYHGSDPHCRGVGISINAWAAGQEPAPPRRTPAERLRTMSEAEKKRIALAVLTAGVPEPPGVLDAVVRLQAERQRQR